MHAGAADAQRDAEVDGRPLGIEIAAVGALHVARDQQHLPPVDFLLLLAVGGRCHVVRGRSVGDVAGRPTVEGLGDARVESLDPRLVLRFGVGLKDVTFGWRDHLEAEAPVGVDHGPHRAQLQVVLHDRRQFLAGALAVEQLVVLDVEPAAVPRLEGVGRALEQVAFHLPRHHLVFSIIEEAVHIIVALLHRLLQLRVLVAHQRHLLVQLLEEIRVVVLTQVGTLVEVSGAGGDVAEQRGEDLGSLLRLQHRDVIHIVQR